MQTHINISLVNNRYTLETGHLDISLTTSFPFESYKDSVGIKFTLPSDDDLESYISFFKTIVTTLEGFKHDRDRL